MAPLPGRLGGPWEALLESGPRGMPQVGLLAPMAEAVNEVVARLTGPNEIRRARLHPLMVLLALLAYRQGHGSRGSLTWTPVPQIIDAPDEALCVPDRLEPRRSPGRAPGLAGAPGGSRWCCR